MNTVLISLVSDQTIPNVELIKEFSNEVQNYLFIHSKQTASHLNWILDATGIDKEQYSQIEVDPFNLKDIEDKLRSFDFKDQAYILNITGGTKLMIIACQEFLKNLGAKIYYVTGRDLEYIKVFPAIGNRTFKLKSKLTLNVYLKSYGFSFTPGETLKGMEQAIKTMDVFLKAEHEKYKSVFELIRRHRSKNIDLLKHNEVKDLLERISFIPEKQDKLNKYENRYLSGDWFEEYVYYKIKQELGLDDSEIGKGYNIIKQNTPNEIDVVFIHNHRLYIIECKTSVFNEQILPNGKIKTVNLLPEILYKSDALRNKLGLFANTSIFTLEELKEIDGTPKENYLTHFERAELSRVNIISRKDFFNKTSIKDLLKIK